MPARSGSIRMGRSPNRRRSSPRSGSGRRARTRASSPAGSTCTEIRPGSDSREGGSMPATVTVNMRTVVHKSSFGVASALPNPCKTPIPGVSHPSPYPNISQSSDTSKGSKKVEMDGNPIMLKDSEFQMSTGDEAGSAGGNVVTNKIKGPAQFIMYSFDVKVEG